jgi:hypothetical protein
MFKEKSDRECLLDNASQFLAEFGLDAAFMAAGTQFLIMFFQISIFLYNILFIFLNLLLPEMVQTDSLCEMRK